MANEEHLAILQQGVDEWNAWREEHPYVQPDLAEVDLFQGLLKGANFQNTLFYQASLCDALLRGAHLQNALLRGTDLQFSDLREADLREACLDGTNFYKAELIRANLQEAYLVGANFYEADLEGVNLQGANLERANFYRANLQGANLIGANLEYASLHGTNLKETNLRKAHLESVNFQGAYLVKTNIANAYIGESVFCDVDLRGVQGLDTVHHMRASSIGIDTLYRSQGQIPEVFLRGCGVPDSMIEYARSLVTAERPIDYYSCFISYSSHDAALAERLYADLQAKGVRCWLAPHDLTPGEVIVRGIDEAIRLHDKVVLLLSEAAVTSHWVAYEVNLATTREAREGRTVLYPLRLDDAVLTTTQGWAQALCEGRHIGDFRRWTEYAAYQAVFARLLRDLKAEQR